MKQLFAIILFITALFSSCDCEKTIEISQIPITPHLVLNALLYADSDTSYFYITKSRPIYTDTTAIWNSYLNWQTIEDAVLNLTVNGKSDYIEYNRTDSAYIFLNKLKEGDKVSIESSYAGQQIQSTVVLPSAPEVLSVDTSSFNRIEYGQLRNFILFKLKIRDNPGTNNYYRLLVSNRFFALWDDEVREYNSPYLYYSNDPVLTDGYTGSIGSNGQINTGLASSLYNYFSIFRDVRFAGKEYTLTFYVDNSFSYWYTPENSEYSKRRHLTVGLQSITEDLYKYYSSLQRSQQIINDKVSEPVIVHTNIDGGLGILGACNEIKVFEYKDF